ncbi:MAG: hypothetical protein JSS66_05110 [Armatimonadetes bacterium]|nr:hypothetical protein [Armatimonadota bacterium]
MSLMASTNPDSVTCEPGNGGDIFVFDTDNPQDVERASQFFDLKLNEGYLAFYVDAFDCTDAPMLTFDPKSGSIIYEPPAKAAEAGSLTA